MLSPDKWYNGNLLTFPKVPTRPWFIRRQSYVSFNERQAMSRIPFFALEGEQYPEMLIPEASLYASLS